MGCFFVGSWNGLFVILGYGMGGVRGKEKKGGVVGVLVFEFWFFVRVVIFFFLSV